MTTRYRYQQPTSDDGFEEFCLALLREAWNRSALERYGHRGEGQFEVDITDQRGAIQLVAAPGKRHAIDKTLPPSELMAKVENALRFGDTTDGYHVATTAKKGSERRDRVPVVNRLHGKGWLFGTLDVSNDAEQPYRRSRVRISLSGASGWSRI